MNYAIICSTNDAAGINIRDRLLELYDFKKIGKHHDNPVYSYKNMTLYTINIETINYEKLEKEIPADTYIFITRHQAVSGERTLSVHIPGNYSKAEFGGSEKTLCTAPANLLKRMYINLDRLNDTDFAVTLEATHHGPKIDTSVMFIEIGSTEKEWSLPEPAKIISKTVVETILEEGKKDYQVAIGFGGNHYCSGFNNIEKDSNIAMSHICPKHAVENITKEMVQEMIKKTSEDVNFALIDWKGLNSEQRQKVITLLNQLNINWKKTKDIRKELS